MPDQPDKTSERPNERPERARGETGPARLYALCAGVLLSLLGVLGFFYDSGFDTGTKLAADDVAGIIVVNGWRNVIYLVTGLLALGFAPRHARRTAAAIACFYLVYGIWGLIGTDHDTGNILEVLPLTDEDNIFHLLVGGLGAAAAIADGPLPKLPSPRARRKPRMRKSPSGSGSAAAKGRGPSRSRA